jgi:Thiol-disulfide isomerase and thioredoxins
MKLTKKVKRHLKKSYITTHRRILIAHILLLISMTCGAQDLAPNFTYQYEDGRLAQLSDLRGGVVYISFWASWCAPCIANFEKYRDIRTQLSDMGVQLLNINVDKDEAKWSNAMSKYDINGIHARGIDLADLQINYKIYSIPIYEIINKKGYQVYLSDLPNRNVINAFKAWLNE